MMSYLWILLLGSLLASHAKAQDDANPEAETVATDLALSEEATEATPVDDGALDAEAETEPETTEAPLDEAEITPANTDAETEEDAVDPTEGDAETVDGATDPAEVDAEAATPTAGDPDAVVPVNAEEPTEGDEITDATAEEDAEVTTVAPGEPEPVTPAVDPASDDAATTEGPAVDSETEQPDDKTEVETAGGTTEATDTDDSTQSAEDITEKDESSIDDSTTVKPIVEEKVPPPKIIPDSSFNLQDALGGNHEEGHQKPKKSRSGIQNDIAPETSESESPEAKQGGSGALAGILSAIVVSAVGAVTGYFAYQKKKLCFKNRQEADPEAAHKADAAEAQADPQVLSTLLDSTKNQQ